MQVKDSRPSITPSPWDISIVGMLLFDLRDNTQSVGDAVDMLETEEPHVSVHENEFIKNLMQVKPKGKNPKGNKKALKTQIEKEPQITDSKGGMKQEKRLEMNK